jgi:hypothetical protein
MSSVKETKNAVVATGRNLTEEQIKSIRAMCSPKRIRTGKTRSDRENGAAHKNAQNRDSRASWQNNRRADGSNSTTFPWASCNGKRNRFQVTGKGGQTVFLADKRK